MQFGIFAKTFPRDTLSEILNAVKSHQFSCIQFNWSITGIGALPTIISLDLQKEVRRIIEKKGLSISAISATYNMIHPNLETREEGHFSLKQIAQSCAKLNAPMITLCTGSRDDQNKWNWHPDNAKEDAWKDLLVSMEKAIKVAEENNIFLGIEPEMANVVRTAKKADELIKILQSDRLKIVFDPANLFEEASKKEINYIIQSSFELLSKHIYMVHGKDRTRDGHFCAAGKGDVNFELLFDLMAQINFNGPFILHGLEEEEVEGSLEYLSSYKKS